MSERPALADMTPEARAAVVELARQAIDTGRSGAVFALTRVVLITERGINEDTANALVDELMEAARG